MKIENMLIRARCSQTKPDINKLKEKGFMNIDMHVHTRFSDTFTRIKNIIKKCEKLGIGIAITDHNSIKGIERALEIKTTITIIPGIEVSTKEGPHVLLYFKNIENLRNFYDEIEIYISKVSFFITNISFYELIRIAKKYDCIICFAHPFAPGYFNIKEIIKQGILDKKIYDMFDTIEVINGVSTKKMNNKSILLAEKFNKKIIGGSDAHTLKQVGTVITSAIANNIEEFFSEIKNNKTLVKGTSINNIDKINFLLKCLPKHASHPFTKSKCLYNNYFKGKIRSIKPKAKAKIDTIKGKSIRAVKNPLYAFKRVKADIDRKITKIKLFNKE
jgi:predicted metal-dependent phosphoesterase TrpH